MNIYVERNGKVHIEDTDNGTLDLHTQNEIVLWCSGAPILKEGGGSFDNVTAFSPAVEEFLTKQKNRTYED